MPVIGREAFTSKGITVTQRIDGNSDVHLVTSILSIDQIIQYAPLVCPWVHNNWKD